MQVREHKIYKNIPFSVNSPISHIAITFCRNTDYMRSYRKILHSCLLKWQKANLQCACIIKQKMLMYDNNNCQKE